jgi:hypothetical protein
VTSEFADAVMAYGQGNYAAALRLFQSADAGSARGREQFARDWRPQ